jgi:outer membrane autotransporter protein
MAYQGAAVASGNAATIAGGEVSGYFYGGFTSSEGATLSKGNAATVAGGEVGGYVYGGYAYSYSSEAISKSNAATIAGGAVIGNVYGGMADSYGGNAEASENSMTLSAGTIGGFIYGGYAWGDGSAKAWGNSVSVEGGNATSVFGGWSDCYGCQAEADNNFVTVSGGTVTGSIIGGWGDGYSGSAKNNSVTLSGAPIIDAVWLYGGYHTSGSADVFSGNSLTLRTTAQITVDWLDNFEYLKFYLPSSISDGDTVLVADNATINDSKISVTAVAGPNKLLVGDRVKLISATVNMSANNFTKGEGLRDGFMSYDFDLLEDSNDLLAVFTGRAVNEGAKGLSEGYAAGLAGLAQAGDLLTGEAISQAAKATDAIGGAEAGLTGGPTWAPFMAMAGGTVRRQTGSHVDYSGVSMILGLSARMPFQGGRAILGAFAEFGAGNYRTYNAFPSLGAVGGEGDVSHVGGGLLARVEFGVSQAAAVYAEASGRVGRLDSDYKNGRLLGPQSPPVSFKTSTAYYGFHVGLGAILRLSETASLDLFAKYIQTTQKGVSLAISNGDVVDFADVNSRRLRVGARATFNAQGRVRPFAGLAWEREFDGKVKGYLYGLPIDAPSYKGDAVVAELGLSIVPAETSPFTLELGVKGYFGKSQGLTGNALFSYKF